MDVKQKCSFHPEVEAVGACVKCGSAVCAQCKRELGIRIHCPECARQYSAERAAALLADAPAVAIPTADRTPTLAYSYAGPQPRKRSGKLTFAGAVCIVGGTMGLILMLLCYPYVFQVSGDETTRLLALVFSPFIVLLTLLAILSIVGGACALRRRRHQRALHSAESSVIFLLVMPSVPVGHYYSPTLGIFCMALGIVFGILGVLFVVRSRGEFES